jgi:hypothetical protein
MKTLMLIDAAVTSLSVMPAVAGEFRFSGTGQWYHRCSARLLCGAELS